MNSPLSSPNIHNSSFQNNITMSEISDQNVLIGYYSARISPSLMHRIMFMDTIPTTVKDWYKKAIHFQIQWEHANEIATRNKKPSNLYQLFSPSSSLKTKDPNIMDIDAIKIPKISNEECKHCQDNGFCFQCRKASHLSLACPTFPSNPKSKKPTTKKVQ